MRILLISLLATSSLFAYTPTPLTEGAKAPEFKLPGVDGRNYSLKDFSGGKALAVIFTTNHCPDAIASHGRMVALVDHFEGESVKFVAINSNSPEGLHPPELGWTVYDDSFEDMRLIAKDSKFNLPYLYDGKTQEVAKAFGAVATPHVFIFDGGLKLRYNGRMDNGKRRLGPVEKNEAREAIEAILAGQKVDPVKTRPVGCSTKWMEKSAMVAGQDRKWKAQPVTVEIADAATLGRLAANKGRNGMRLLNLWSTSCGPCVAEFPELAKIYRQYSWQEFEFIPISLDPATDIDKVTKFLKQNECGLSPRTKPLLDEEKRTTNNYLFDGDTEDLAKAIDPEWNGALPYTILVGKEGKILFRHSGVIVPMELKKKIVEQVWAKSAE
ncbi:MAG: redoxin domain-containing protein [Akkermansiaceae bacterium]|nr:redoxin domain-containing protein [Akkermansiaceae bacterium]